MENNYMTDIFNNAQNLGFGLMRLPLHENPANDADIDMDELCRMVDTFLERGFTYFDTALMYCGEASEDAIRRALVERHARSEFTLTDKLHHAYFSTEEECDTVFAGQLKRTGVSRFDYYLVHDVNTESYPKYERLHVFEWAQKKKAEGKIKHVGFSFHDSPELLEEVLTKHPEVEFVQLQINYLDYDNPGINSRKCYEIAVKHDKPVIVMEPVKGGTLVRLPEDALAKFKAYNPEASAASWAIRFAASHENVRMVLSGMSCMAHMLDNTTFMADFQPLSVEEKAIVADVVEELKKTIAIPCTGCSYCTGGCPMQIPIPKYFALYNAQMREDPEGKAGWTPQVEYYGNYTLTNAGASTCIECGQCEGICPQHLPVTEWLKKVADKFER